MPTRPPTHRRVIRAKRHLSEREANRQRTREHHTGSKAWAAIRRWVLARDSYTCRQCGKYGNQVDHVDGDSTNNPEDGSNWQCLCRRCHSAKTMKEMRERGLAR